MSFDLEVIMSWAKRRGFVYPGSDIYGGLANAWDYGPYGIQLKKNIQDLRWKTFVQQRPDMIGLDAQILMHPKVWEASGHVAGFNDPLIDDKNTGERFRADKIIEEKIEEKREKYEKKFSLSDENLGYVIRYTYIVNFDIESKDLWKSGDFSDIVEEYIIEKIGGFPKSVGGYKWESSYSKNISSDKQPLSNSVGKFELSFIVMESNKSFPSSIVKILDNIDIEGVKITKVNESTTKIKVVDALKEGPLERFYLVNMLILNDIRNLDILVKSIVPESWTHEQMKDFIVAEIPNNPDSGKPAEWTDVRTFELMYYTYQGVIHDEDNKIWMRPETAQGIFVNFKNILDTTRMRVPFGIAQVGKAFRNEITPGNFLYRTREFEQMEIEYFVENKEDAARISFEEWKELSMTRWREQMQFQEANIRFREHEADELSHYSKGTFDVEYKYPRGRGELQGIARRGDFDLTQHQEHSGKSMQYQDPYTGQKYIPHVIEPSFGLSRTVLAAMFDSYDEETYTDGNGNEQTRVVARFPEQLAPVRYAILPLIKKDDQQVQLAKELYARLSEDYMVEYDDRGNIGKRYRRQDEIGTPRCVTIDHQSLEDGTVTLRDRDTMEQKRVKIEEVG